MRTEARLRERGRAISANSLERSTKSASSPEQSPLLPARYARSDGPPPRPRDVRRTCDRRALTCRRTRRRHDAAGEGPLEGGSGCRRCTRGPPSRRRRRHLGDQREDHHDRHGRGDPRGGAFARVEPCRREPALGDRIRPRRRPPRRARPVRSRRRSAPGGARADEAAGRRSRQSLSRPARSVRRAGARRRALADRGGETSRHRRRSS